MGKLPAMGWERMVLGYERGSWANEIVARNSWADASHAHQLLRSCNISTEQYLLGANQPPEVLLHIIPYSPVNY